MRSVPLFLLPLLLAVSAAQAAPATPAPLRIGLDHSFRHSTSVLVGSERPFALLDPLTNKTLFSAAGGTDYRMTVSAAGMTLARRVGASETPVTGHFAAVLLVPGAGGFCRIARMGGKAEETHHYRGTLTVRRDTDGALRVINTIPLETYLYGVIPAEIGTKVPAEAMKAQAVAARTYALKNRGKCVKDGFDLDDTTRCEGYLGVDGETAASNAAVDATRGQVLTWQGTLIDAPYSTDSGGVTACDTNGDCPYLQAVKDCDADGADYAADGKYHTWSKAFAPAQIAALLGKDPRSSVSGFASLTVDGLDASGRVTTATVWGAGGASKTITGPQMRQILGYDVLRSTRLTLTRTAAGEYQFNGRGWGHGLGMSQDGAVCMAGPAYRKTYQQILKHYYVGTQLAALDTVSAALPSSSLKPQRGF